MTIQEMINELKEAQQEALEDIAEFHTGAKLLITVGKAIGFLSAIEFVDVDDSVSPGAFNLKS